MGGFIRVLICPKTAVFSDQQHPVSIYNRWAGDESNFKYNFLFDTYRKGLASSTQVTLAVHWS